MSCASSVSPTVRLLLFHGHKTRLHLIGIFFPEMKRDHVIDLCARTLFLAHWIRETNTTKICVVTWVLVFKSLRIGCALFARSSAANRREGEYARRAAGHRQRVDRAQLRRHRDSQTRRQVAQERPAHQCQEPKVTSDIPRQQSIC